MSSRAASRIAWSLWTLSVVPAVGGLVLYVLTRSFELGGGSRAIEQLFAFGFLAYATVGTLITSRRPGNRIGWLFLFAALAWGAHAFLQGYAAYGVLERPGSLPGGEVAAWAEGWIWVPAIGFTTTLLLLLFPDGRLLSRRWLPVVALAAFAWTSLMLGAALRPGPLDDFPSVENPLDLVGFGGADTLEGLGWFFAPLAGVLSAISLLVRFRRARGDERLQLKWFASAAALVALAMASSFFGGEEGRAGVLVTEAIFALSVAGIAIAAGVAIFKHRLYDIDLIIRRTLVYGVLTAGLAGLYFGIVLALQQVFSGFAGGSDLAIAGSTLAVAALFRPARRRIQAVVDRRFYRRKYDAQRTLEAFSARLREEIDLEALAAELRAVVRETMQPAHVSLWLRTPTEAGR